VPPDLTVATTRQIPLGRTFFINRDGSGGPAGIFSGPTATIVVVGTRALLITNVMVPVTEFAVRPIGPHTSCESWAIWGATEIIGGVPWISYVRDNTTIVRQNLFTGATETVASFTNLADMCSFTIDPMRNRWYFHHEGMSQFATGDETIGFCPATFAR
jgi:hypothetical protein